MKTILGVHHVHTENSGWSIEVVQEDGFVMIDASIDGHCATSSAKLTFSGKEPGKGLTARDLEDIGKMFYMAAIKLDGEADQIMIRA